MSSGSPFEYSDRRGFFQRYGLALGIGVAAVVVLIIAIKALSGGGDAPRSRNSDMVMLKPLAPVPTPPPPPPQQQPVPQNTPQKQAMMDQTPVAAEDPKPAEAPQESAAPMGTNLTGSGGPDYGLAHGGGGGKIGGRSGGGGGGPFSAYAAKVQRSIMEALQRDPRTRHANFNLSRLRISFDPTGRITRVGLGGSTGDPAIDAALRDEILKGLQLPDSPPDGMPSPINLRIAAHRPNG